LLSPEVLPVIKDGGPCVLFAGVGGNRLLFANTDR
jgi:hypothetical protein